VQTAEGGRFIGKKKKTLKGTKFYCSLGIKNFLILKFCEWSSQYITSVQMKFYSCVREKWGLTGGSKWNINGCRLKGDVEAILEWDLHFN
jgi:hypothetical protein